MLKNDQLLRQLVYMFHTSAIQGLGIIADPSGKVTLNLEYVSQTIDLMKMLKDKTKGNITVEIERELDGLISELNLNYMSEKSNTQNEVKNELKI